MNFRLHIDGQPLTRQEVSSIFMNYGMAKVYETFHEDGHDFIINYPHPITARTAFEAKNGTCCNNGSVLQLFWLDDNDDNVNNNNNNNNVVKPTVVNNNNKPHTIVVETSGDPVTAEQIYKLFSGYGAIAVHRPNNSNIFHITYTDVRDAADAFKELGDEYHYIDHNRHTLLRLSRFGDSNNKAKVSSSCDVSIVNDNSNIYQVIKELEKYGKIAKSEIVIKVTFEDPRDAEDARKAFPRYN